MQSYHHKPFSNRTHSSFSHLNDKVGLNKTDEKELPDKEIKNEQIFKLFYFVLLYTGRKHLTQLCDGGQ